MRALAIVTVLAWTASDAAAETYVVSPGGDDDAAGTSAAPFATLQHAARVVKPGDKVVVMPGRYQGFDLRKSGKPGAPIIFSGKPGAVIDRDNPKTRRDGINIENASHIRIENLEVVGAKRTGIRAARCHHVTIAGNRLHKNGRWGIFTAFCDDLLIEANEATRSGREHGVYVSNSGDRPVIRGNVLWGNNKAGVHMNGDAGEGGDGIISDAVVEANLIFKNGARGASGVNCDGVQSSVIRNNLIFDNQASGISLYRIDGAAGSTGNLVINNTIIVGDRGRWAINIQNGSGGNKILNNILLNRHRYRGSVNVSADSLEGLVSDHNVVMDRFTTDDGDSRMGLGDWQKKTGQDRHSVIASIDELFTDEKDFQLKPGCAAVDAGAPVPLQLSDRLGVARPVGKGVDIGAHELCSSGRCAKKTQSAVTPSVPPEEVPSAARPRSRSSKSGCQSCATAKGGGGAVLVLAMLLGLLRRA